MTACGRSRSHGARGLWLTGFEELFFAIDQGIDVVGGELESMTVRDRVGGAGFDAVSAENAARIIDVVDAWRSVRRRRCDCVSVFSAASI